MVCIIMIIYLVFYLFIFFLKFHHLNLVQMLMACEALVALEKYVQAFFSWD